MIFDDIESQFKELDNEKTEADFIKEDAYVLQANYLSEIERISKEKNLNRKKLAQEISISPSYLTQVFRGDKPLNFITLAKIKRALGIGFELKGYLLAEKKTQFEISAPIGKRVVLPIIDIHQPIKMQVLKGDKFLNQTDPLYKQLA